VLRNTTRSCAVSTRPVQAHPLGAFTHACFGSGDELQLFKIWESQQDFGKSVQTTMPILQQIGLDLGRPIVDPV